METVSDNSRGRGRPRKYAKTREPGYLDEFVRYESDPTRGIVEKFGHSMRQQQNIIMAERAADYFREYYESGRGVLSRTAEGISEETTDRYDVAGFITEATLDIPQRVLTELGRFLPDDEEALWRAVLWYARYPWRLRAQDGARCIRELRLGRRIALPGE
jgi:hypothetical protein